MDPCSNISLSKTQDASQITIELENPVKVYFSGETVKGRIKFKALTNQVVQTLSVYLRGEFFYKKANSENVERIFLESSPIDFRGAGEGNIESDFNLRLRPESPSSLESPLGGVRYRILANLVFKEEDSTKSAEASQLISVNCPKRIPAISSGREVSTVERAGLLCCIGAVRAEMEVNQTLLVCGRSAVVNGRVFNGTHAVVERTQILLRQKVERERDGRTAKRTALSIPIGAVLPGKGLIWSGRAFDVPPLPPTSADPFFRTSYKLVLEIQKIGGKIIKLKIPIVIGNVLSSDENVLTCGLGSLHNDANSEIECMCSNFSDEPEGFKPLYVTYAKR